MSGFGGFVAAPGSSLRRNGLDAMTAALAWRGLDATTEWTSGDAVFIHTQFNVNDTSAREDQPILIGDRFVVLGDVRLDRRHELVARLQAAGSAAIVCDSDTRLVEQAWLIWRHDCVQHLSGDFSFLVWDRAKRRLFAARDPFGVRPFYYAGLASGLVVGNMLAAVRAHAGVPANLDDGAILDGLVFRHFQDAASTAFAAIRRLPGGHTLTWQGERTEIHQYWAGFPERAIRYRRDDEYVERYRELLTRAVADRLPTGGVAVAMTGGLDSSSLAASAVAWRRSQGAAVDLEAHTIVYDHLIPDREREFAGAVANHLGIPIVFTAADDRRVYDRATDPAEQPPEPVDDPFRAMLTDFYRGVADRSRVLLMGLDGDTLLNEIASDYLIARLRRGEVAEYAKSAVAYVRTRGELPPHRVRATIRSLFGRDQTAAPALPVWIDPGMAKRFDLRARLESHPQSQSRPVKDWPLRVRATSVLGSPIWASMFNRHDAEHLGARVETRFPFTDVRLVDFLLNIPAVPWCIDKYITRRAMVNRLPPAVLARPKSPMAADTARARLDKGDRLPWCETFRPHPLLARYVNVGLLAERCRRGTAAIDPSVDTRALMLNEWLWYHRPRN